MEHKDSALHEWFKIKRVNVSTGFYSLNSSLSGKYSGRFIFLLSICSAFWQSSCAKLNIVSNPVEADVTIQNAENGSGKKLGKTPYNIDMDELESYIKDGPALITVSKTGFESRNYVIPYFNFADLKINVNLSEVSKTNDGEETARINRMVRLVLLAYQSVFKKESEQARKLVEGLDQQFPGIAAPWLIQALSSIQDGNKEQARGFLARAQALDPQDSNIAALLEAIKE